MKASGRFVPGALFDAQAEAHRIRSEARAEREQARSDARDEREATRRAAVEQGRAEGRDAAAAEVLELLVAARREAATLRASASDEVVAVATKLAVKMAEKIVGAAVEADPAHLARMAHAALTTSRVRAGRVVLRIHPDDHSALAPRLATLSAALPAAHVEVVKDETVGRHGCVVDTPSGRVDARLHTQLAALERALAPGAR